MEETKGERDGTVSSEGFDVLASMVRVCCYRTESFLKTSDYKEAYLQQAPASSSTDETCPNFGLKPWHNQ